MFKPYLNLPRPVYILCVGTLINRTGTFLMFFLTLYLTTAREFSEQFATLAMGTFGAGSIVANLLGGSLADRYGRRKIMLVSLWGAVAVLLVFGFLQSKAAILGGVAIFATLAELYRPSSSAMIADLTSPAERSYAYGLIFLALNLGTGFAALIGGALALVSFQYLFWADAFTTAVCALIIMKTIAETLPVLPTAKTDEPAENTHGTNAYGNILRNYTFMIFCLGCFCMGLVYMQSWSTLPLYFRHLGFGPEVYGRVVALNPFLIVIFQIPVTSLISRLPRGLMLTASGIVIAIGFGATGWVGSPLGLTGTVAIWTIGEMMQAPLMPSTVSDLAPVAFRARYMGVFTMCFASANVFGAPIGGYILTEQGAASLWRACLLAGLFSALCFCAIIKSVSQPVVEGPSEA